jgi:hypothetical protein
MISRHERSWNRGRADGMRGLPAKCPKVMDAPSYANGYMEGKAKRKKYTTRAVDTSEAKASGLSDAVYALTELAAGRTPERSRLLAGALALSALVQHGKPDRDLLDAVAGLNAWAAGGLELDDRERVRAGHLAAVVQRIATVVQRRWPSRPAL